MQQPIEDKAMDRGISNGEHRARVSPGYILAAAVIWGAVLYSLTSPQRPEPERVTLNAWRACLR